MPGSENTSLFNNYIVLIVLLFPVPPIPKSSLPPSVLTSVKDFESFPVDAVTYFGSSPPVDIILSVFLKKMIRRPSATPEGDPEALPPEDTLRLLGHDEEGNAEVDYEAEMEAAAWRGRRRSSLDRVLRQHAYIIICVLCYACTLPGHRT
ncbi:hypothetical protein Hamer_G027288 [Homarus americanus]|uniref:Uncharacterized protein n=1 Tax=Homarus americanus TaxID=6706 RepID=A0A8J5N242_HOMAM|nr:hypothetical protein Hamer_G027288 [Homarus americanus]